MAGIPSNDRTSETNRGQETRQPISDERTALVRHGRNPVVRSPPPPDYGAAQPSSTAASAISHASSVQRLSADIALHPNAIYYLTETPGRHVDTHIPDAYLALLGAGQRAVVDAIRQVPAQEWTRVALVGDVNGSGLRLGYTCTVRGSSSGEHRAYRVTAHVVAAGNGGQRLERYTVRQLDAPLRFSVPTPQPLFEVTAIDPQGQATLVRTRLPPVGVTADPLLLAALSSSDRRDALLRPDEQGAHTLTYVTANPFHDADLYVTLTIPNAAARRNVAVEASAFGAFTGTWLRGTDEDGPGFPDAIVEQLARAMCNPDGSDARFGYSSQGDYFVQLSGARVPDDDEPWNVRLDLAHNGNRWEVAVVQHSHVGVKRHTTWRPDTPDFTNPRRPRDRTIGSPPASTASTASTQSTRRQLESTPTHPRALPRPRLADPGPQATQEQYRALLDDPYRQAAVCGPLAAGAAMDVGVPFDRVLAVAADVNVGLTMAEVRILLANHGVYTAAPIEYGPMQAQWTNDAVANDLRATMEDGGFDRAVLVYGTPIDGDDLPSHFVTIWRVGDQWKLHNGIADPPTTTLPQPPWQWLADNLYGARQHILMRQLEVLPFQLPPDFRRAEHEEAWQAFVLRPRHGAAAASEATARATSSTSVQTTSHDRPEVTTQRPAPRPSEVQPPTRDEFLSGLGRDGRFVSGRSLRRTSFEEGGLMREWRAPDIDLVHRSAAACLPLLQSAQMVDAQLNVYAFYDVEVGGYRLDLALQFEDANCRRAVDIYRITPTVTLRRILDCVQAISSRRVVTRRALQGGGPP